MHTVVTVVAPGRRTPGLEGHADGSESLSRLLVWIELALHRRAVTKLADLKDERQQRKGSKGLEAKEALLPGTRRRPSQVPRRRDHGLALLSVLLVVLLMVMVASSNYKPLSMGG